VLDNCTSHNSKKTIDFVALNHRLELHFLPPYSPDFNPDELVWAHLKGKSLKAHQARTTVELRSKTLGNFNMFMENWKLKRVTYSVKSKCWIFSLHNSRSIFGLTTAFQNPVPFRTHIPIKNTFE